MSEPTSDPLTPPLESLYWTQYGTWYPIFRKHAPKSTVIDIETVQPELLGWLESDTFVLPEGSGPSTLSTASSCSSSSALSDTGLSEDEDEDEDPEDEEPVKLQALDEKIREVISKYDGGPVFPKLNWSAPLDAGFMLPGNNLQCLHPEDVYLLLKSSEFVGRDLEQIAATTNPSSTTTITADSATTGEDGALEVVTEQQDDSTVTRRIRPQLVLKKWFQLARSFEFRCFIRAHTLIAISQRDVTFYDHLQSPHLQSQIRSAIWEFWEDVVDQKHKEGTWGSADYVMDVYLTKDMGRVWLIDVNAWLPRTDTLLWTFEELEEVHRREKGLRRAEGVKGQEAGVEEGVVRLHISPSAAGATETEKEVQEANGKDETHEGESEGEEAEEWGESDVELRVLSDRRMQSSGGTGATYSSNMVPKDLVEFAKSNKNNGTSGAQNMGVEEIVERWNAQVVSEKVEKQGEA